LYRFSAALTVRLNIELGKRGNIIAGKNVFIGVLERKKAKRDEKTLFHDGCLLDALHDGASAGPGLS
jgi:hypothetical protein